MKKLKSSGIFALLVAALSLAPTPVRADDTADEAEFRFRRGAELYAKGRVEEALSEFFESNRLARNRNVGFNIARCLEQLSLHDEAFRWYMDLVGEPWGPDDRKALDESLARLRPKLALLRVETEPPGATIFVDRRDLGARGTSPRVLALPAGPVKVLAELAGFRTAEAPATLARGSEATVRLNLERIVGRAHVTSEPPGAAVRVDPLGDPLAAPIACETPCTLPLVPGKHTLFVSAYGFVGAGYEVSITADELRELPVRLAPKPPPVGSLVVEANRANAKIVVDERVAGFTPAVVRNVPVGKHVVTVSFEDLEPFTTVVDVAEGQSLPVKARLSVPAPRVVAAGKALASAEDAPASVSVISAEEIRAFGYRTLAQALRGVRGLYFTDDRGYEYLGVRGFSPPGDFNMRALLLSDGHAFNDTWVGQAGFGHDFDVDLSQIERIEVVRGPGSVLYGSQAVFGVVNVVRRTAPRDGNVEVFATGGNAGTRAGRATAGFERGAVGGSVSAAGLWSDGERSFPGPDGAVATGLDGQRAFHASANAHAGDFSLVALWQERKKSLPTGAYGADFGVPGSFFRDRRGYVEGRWERTLQGGTKLTARGYFDHMDYLGNTVRGGVPEADWGIANWAGAEVRAHLQPLLGQRLTLGAELQRQLAIAQSSEPGVERTGTVLSAYALDDWRLSPRVLLSAGVRVDSFPGGFGVSANPRLALVARPYEAGLTKLLYGQAFRAPSVYERFYADPQQAPSPELGPERVKALELEHTHRVDEELTILASVFGSRLDGVVELQPSGDLVQYRNSTEPVLALGGEAEVRWQPSRLSLVSFAWSWQLARDGQGRPLPNAPANVAALRGMAPVTAGVTLAGEALYAAPRRTLAGDLTGETLQLNAVVSGGLGRWGLRYELAVRNLLDERPAYPVGPDFPAPSVVQPGRTVLLTVGAAL